MISKKIPEFRKFFYRSGQAEEIIDVTKFNNSKEVEDLFIQLLKQSEKNYWYYYFYFILKDDFRIDQMTDDCIEKLQLKEEDLTEETVNDMQNMARILRQDLIDKAISFSDFKPYLIKLFLFYVYAIFPTYTIYSLQNHENWKNT